MIMVVEDRRLQCWNCKRLGHFSISCPQKTTKPTSLPSTTTATTAAAVITITNTSPKPETGVNPNKEGKRLDPGNSGRQEKSPLKTQKLQLPLLLLLLLQKKKKTSSSLSTSMQKRKKEKKTQILWKNHFQERPSYE